MTGPVFDPELKRGSLRRRWAMTADDLARAARLGRWLGLTLWQIADVWGCRTHSTVLVYLRRPLADRT